jgi:hypothetical protein
VTNILDKASSNYGMRDDDFEDPHRSEILRLVVIG